MIKIITYSRYSIGEILSTQYITKINRYLPSLTISLDPLLCCTPVSEAAAPSPEAGRDQSREAASV